MRTREADISTSSSPASTSSPSQLRRVIVASFIGTTIEWYDFFLYGTASALVFNKVFFPTLNPLAGTLSAYATFAVGFVARPLGGIVFGHYGDRVGRKTMLVWSLVIMGVASAAMGLVPTYDRIGVWAPVFLVALRFIQGFGVGGEWGGAVLLAVEHSGGNRRGLHGSWPQMGVPAGLLLSTGIFALISAKLSNEAFLDWGWRVPFLLSIVLVGIGLFVRLRVSESPAFREIERQGASRAPLVDAIKRHPRAVLVGAGMRFAQNVLFYLYTVFVPGYGEKTLHYPRSTMLGAVMIASVVGLVSIPFWSYLSDRVGRKPVYLAGGIVSLLFALPFFGWIERGPAWVAPAIVIGMIGHDMMYGPMAAYFCELFGTSVRYSGASLIYQLTSVFSGGLAPFIATLLLIRHGSRAVAMYVMACCTLTLLATWFAPETHRRVLSGGLGRS